MKIVQINATQNSGSTGKIAEQIGELIQSNGWESYIVSGRGQMPTSSKSIRINSRLEVLLHIFIKHFAALDGRGSICATKRLVKQLKQIQPDLIHLHVIHESYINYPILFEYLHEEKIPVVWTFHDCWAFTGHCSHFDFIKCDKWKTKCYNCPASKNINKIEFFIAAKSNFRLKKNAFTSVPKMTICPVSHWLGNLVKESFLSKYNVCIIHNGIDLDVFKPRKSSLRETLSIGNKFVVLGVANGWGKRKGYDDFIEIATRCPKWVFIMVGNRNGLSDNVPQNIITVPFTSGQIELSEYYSISNVFLNTTYEDTYPTVNLESIACGTPVLTYKTGGSPESVTEDTGIVIPQGNVSAAIEALALFENKDKEAYSAKCRKYAEDNFSNKEKFQQYIELYKELLHNQ